MHEFPLVVCMHISATKFFLSIYNLLIKYFKINRFTEICYTLKSTIYTKFNINTTHNLVYF